MGDFSDIWDEHIAESPITRLVEEGFAGNDSIPFDLNDYATMIGAEIVFMHAIVRNMALALDNLIEASDA